MSGESGSKLNASYYRLMVYAALFGALSSLLTAGYITLQSGHQVLCAANHLPI
ncbi:MAG TPA: hypothetical protein VH500_14205 [Nitrososphaeraceae archaeon]